MNTAGTTSRLSSVEVIRSPITAITIGERKIGSAPGPSASGNMPVPMAMGLRYVQANSVVVPEQNWSKSGLAGMTILGSGTSLPKAAVPG